MKKIWRNFKWFTPGYDLLAPSATPPSDFEKTFKFPIPAHVNVFHLIEPRTLRTIQLEKVDYTIKSQRKTPSPSSSDALLTSPLSHVNQPLTVKWSGESDSLHCTGGFIVPVSLFQFKIHKQPQSFFLSFVCLNHKLLSSQHRSPGMCMEHSSPIKLLPQFNSTSTCFEFLIIFEAISIQFCFRFMREKKYLCGKGICVSWTIIKSRCRWWCIHPQSTPWLGWESSQWFLSLFRPSPASYRPSNSNQLIKLFLPRHQMEYRFSSRRWLGAALSGFARKTLRFPPGEVKQKLPKSNLIKRNHEMDVLMDVFDFLRSFWAAFSSVLECQRKGKQHQ